MIAVFGLVAPFFALIAAGFAAARISPQPPGATVWLNVFVIYVALPAMFVQLLSQTPVEELASVGFVVATTSSTLFAFLLVFLLRLRRTRDVAGSTVDGLAGAYGNIGYMGPGLALAAFGPGAAVPVALVFCFDNILHFALAPSLMTLAGERKGSALRVAAEIGRRILLHPFILATIAGLGLAVAEVDLPGPVARLVALLGGAAAPCALFLMGVTLASRRETGGTGALALVMPVKLGVQPVLCWLILGIAGDFDPVWVRTAVLLAALPTATNVFVIAQQYGVGQDRASRAVLLTTVVSVVTVTGTLALLLSGAVPLDPFPN